MVVVQAYIVACVRGEYELSATDKLALTPLEVTIFSRRRHSWVMPGRPRARDLHMSGFCRANTLSRTMAKRRDVQHDAFDENIAANGRGGVYGRGVVSVEDHHVFINCRISKCEPYSDVSATL